MKGFVSGAQVGWSLRWLFHLHCQCDQSSCNMRIVSDRALGFGRKRRRPKCRRFFPIICLLTFNAVDFNVHKIWRVGDFIVILRVWWKRLHVRCWICQFIITWMSLLIWARPISWSRLHILQDYYRVFNVVPINRANVVVVEAIELLSQKLLAGLQPT